MNRTSLYVTILFALLLATAASVLVATRINQTSEAPATQNVVVAARDLEIGTSLAKEDLKLVAWTTGTVPQGTYTNVDDLAGRAVLYPMYTGEAVLEPKLAATGMGGGLPAVIPEGMRAVSIRVDEVVAVAGFVTPGTRVDVLLTGNAGSESLTKTILEDVQVLAAGQKIQPDAQGRAEKVNVVTLLCSSEDAAKVTLAANDGRIQLVLRNPMDKQKAEKTVQVARGALYGKPAAPVTVVRRVVVHEATPVPAPEPAAVFIPEPVPAPVIPEKHTVTVIRGDRTSTVDVDPKH